MALEIRKIMPDMLHVKTNFYQTVSSLTSGIITFEMRAQNARELEHVDGFFGAEDFGEFGVRDDETLVFRILQVMLFDVVPDFFSDLWT